MAQAPVSGSKGPALQGESIPSRTVKEGRSPNTNRGQLVILAAGEAALHKEALAFASEILDTTQSEGATML